ncbi:MAG: hypothetical protein UT63_C0011G0028 [Candidatus Gottesmanbacteria bacterium GW2011_GWC2_39_8]|uniref:Uncharacterized protein n=1 Tax=Candidatus Gottesmanbacteria bacterium GW2011_GWC2_39_8 TaxID=1618450 RepID=A0A0G0Q939_9BACT|nr:MAG: hypothetical protein UT63_C0011G0028 [Candidatus Gottesmanbacteria bacterium GW2011_GWC2_39_8]
MVKPINENIRETVRQFVHDLKNELTVIRINCIFLRKEIIGDEKKNSYVDKVDAKVETILKETEELLKNI